MVMVIEDVLIMEGKRSFWCNNAILSGMVAFSMAILFSIVNSATGLLIVSCIGIASVTCFIVSFKKWSFWKKELIHKAGAHAWMI